MSLPCYNVFMESEVEIYHSEKGEIIFNIDKHAETIWASIDEIANLFNVTRRSIEIHIKNIFDEGELVESKSAKESFVVRREGSRDVRRKIRLYNLDAIISIGYRVNSKKATDFRIWSTTVLNKYLTTGVVINEHRLSDLDEKKLHEVEGMMGVVRRLVANVSLGQDDATGVLEILSKYSESFKTLNEYDSGHIDISGINTTPRHEIKSLDPITVENLITRLKSQTKTASKISFGVPKQGTIADIITKIDPPSSSAVQTTPPAEDIPTRAAHILYNTVKLAPFESGNNEIAALLFILFLTENNYRVTAEGETKLSDRALTALTLLISESSPKEQPLLLSLIIRILED